MFTIKKLTFCYEDRPLFDDYSLQIPSPGVLYGPNGHGKTTLLKLFAGVLTPQGGELLCGEKRQFRSVFFGDDRLILDVPSCGEQYAWSLGILGKGLADVQEFLDLAQVAPLLDRCPAHLSTGQRHWVALCYALLPYATVDAILLDEPLRALDAHHQALFFRLIAYITRTTDARVLMTAPGALSRAPL